MAYRERSSTEEYTGNGRSPAEIEGEIERTRAEMDQTLAALERKLSPGELMDQAIGYLRGPRDFYSNLGTTVRDNPIPVTLVGIGLAWLMAETSGHLHQGEMAGYGFKDKIKEKVDSSGIKEKIGAAKESVSDYTGQVKERISGAKESMGSVKEKISGAKESVGTRMQRSKERVSEKISGSGEELSHYGETTRHRTRDVRENIGNLFQEQPVFSVLAGLALGAVAAAIFPTTRKEREMAGEIGGELKKKFAEKSEETIEGAKKVIGAAGDAAREEAQKQNLYTEYPGEYKEYRGDWSGEERRFYQDERSPEEDRRLH